MLTKDYDYDSQGRLEEVSHFADTNGNHQYDAGDGTSGGETLFEQSLYNFFADGRRSDEVRTDADGEELTAAWTYDGLGRLASEAMDVNGATLGGDFNFSEAYVHDLTGNRLEVTRQQGGTTTTTSSIYDSATDAKDAEAALAAADCLLYGIKEYSPDPKVRLQC